MTKPQGPGYHGLVRPRAAGEEDIQRREDGMSTIRVKCPACREVMEVNTRTGKIEKHHPEIRHDRGGDFLKDRLRALDEEKAKREALVAEGREKERGKKAAHEELFSKVKKTAKEGPAEKPLRDIDID